MKKPCSPHRRLRCQCFWLQPRSAETTTNCADPAMEKSRKEGELEKTVRHALARVTKTRLAPRELAKNLKKKRTWASAKRTADIYCTTMSCNLKNELEDLGREGRTSHRSNKKVGVFDSCAPRTKAKTLEKRIDERYNRAPEKCTRSTVRL